MPRFKLLRLLCTAIALLPLATTLGDLDDNFDPLIDSAEPQSSPIPENVPKHWQALADMVRSEEILVHLQTQLPDLQKSIAKLKLPDEHSRELFDERVSVIDLKPVRVKSPAAAPLGASAQRRTWNPTPERSVERKQLKLWRSIMKDAVSVEDVHIETVDGDFIDGDFRKMRSPVGSC